MSKGRLGFLFAIFLLFGAMILLRLFSLQIKSFELYQKRSQAQQLRQPAFKRGNIFAQDKEGKFFLIATTKSYLRLYAIPSKIPLEKREELAQFISRQFVISHDTLLERLSKRNDSYEPLKEGIPFQEKQNIEALMKEFSSMLKLEEYTDRFYPYGSLASQVIGFVGFEGERKAGLAGIERRFDDVLVQGNQDLIVTLDIFLEQESEKVLQELLERFKAKGGSIIIMRPNDGAILAMASKPDFDPSRFKEVTDISIFLNPAVQKVFEPGSIVKPITMAAWFQTGKITPDTTYVDRGFVEKGGYVIKNAGERVFGKRTMREVLEFSINTGAIFVQEQVGQKEFLQTFENFGFGEKTGIDLPGELAGDISNLDSGRPVNFATASFGQGISTTPLQFIAAIGAIANEGTLMKPFLVQKIVSPEREITIAAQRKRVVIKQENAAKLVALMVEVVEKGYSKKASVPGYLVAGKTGTSQIPDPEGGYLDETIHSFVGFAPAFDPAFVVLIKLDAPEGPAFASESIAPYFSRLAQYILQYYGILPEKPVE